MDGPLTLILVALAVIAGAFWYDKYKDYKRYKSQVENRKIMKKLEEVKHEIANTDLDILVDESNDVWSKRDHTE